MFESFRVWQNSGLQFLFSPSASVSAITPAHANSPEASFLRTLPECFHYYWQRVRLPIRIIWTYWELDDDMRYNPDMQRLSLWRSIMEAKHWKEEQVCFWPMAVRTLPDGVAELRIDVLANLLKSFAPTHVLSFGERSHAAFRGHFARFTDDLPKDCAIHYLPGAEDMLPDNREAKAKTWLCIKHLSI